MTISPFLFFFDLLFSGAFAGFTTGVGESETVFTRERMFACDGGIIFRGEGFKFRGGEIGSPDWEIAVGELLVCHLGKTAFLQLQAFGRGVVSNELAVAITGETLHLEALHRTSGPPDSGLVFREFPGAMATQTASRTAFRNEWRRRNDSGGDFRNQE